MNESPLTNPAQRAIAFLDGYRSASATRDGGMRNKQVRNALADMYDVPANDNSAIMTVMSDAWKLPGAIRNSIEKTGLNHESFVHVTKDLETVLSQMHPDTQAQQIVNNIPPTLSSSLGMISSILNKDLPEAMLTDEKIDELMSSIEDFEKEVREAKFEDEFADFILHRTDSIKYAINHYDTLGPDVVMARVDHMFGGVLRSYKSLTDTKKKKTITNRLLNIGASILFAMNAFNTVVELPENLNKFLGDGVIHEGKVIVDPPAEVPDPSDVIA